MSDVEGLDVDQGQAAFRILAPAQQNLDGKGGLHRPKHAGHGTQHANFVAGLDRAGWWRVGMKVPVRGACGRFKERQTAFKAMHGGVNPWRIEQRARVVDEVACRDQIGAVDDEVMTFEQRQGVAWVQARDVDMNVEFGVKVEHALRSHFGLVATNVFCAIQDLPLKV